jgi:hypothetical protein
MVYDGVSGGESHVSHDPHSPTFPLVYASCISLLSASS